MREEGRGGRGKRDRRAGGRESGREREGVREREGERREGGEGERQREIPGKVGLLIVRLSGRVWLLVEPEITEDLWLYIRYPGLKIHTLLTIAV